MDPDMLIKDTSGPRPADLVRSLNENCKAAENLAIETVISTDAPVINAFRELTRGDCWLIMVSVVHFLI